MSKILSPRAWYLVGIGATALAIDGTRRLVKRRQQQAAGQATITVENGVGEVTPPVSATPAAQPAPTPATASRATVPPATKTPPAAKTAAKPQIAAKASSSTKRSSSQKGDDLTKIKGIGPTFAKRLNEAGITTFAAVAAAKSDYLREVTKANAAANPDEWIAEARLK